MTFHDVRGRSRRTAASCTRSDTSPSRGATTQLPEDRASYDVVDVSGTAAWEHDVVRVHAVQLAEQRRWPDGAGRRYRAPRLRAALRRSRTRSCGVARVIERLQFRDGHYRQVVAVSEQVREDLVASMASRPSASRSCRTRSTSTASGA